MQLNPFLSGAFVWRRECVDDRLGHSQGKVVSIIKSSSRPHKAAASTVTSLLSQGTFITDAADDSTSGTSLLLQGAGRSMIDSFLGLEHMLQTSGFLEPKELGIKQSPNIPTGPHERKEDFCRDVGKIARRSQ